MLWRDSGDLIDQIPVFWRDSSVGDDHVCIYIRVIDAVAMR